MSGNNWLGRAVLVLLAIGTLAVPAAAAARVEPCKTDRRFVDAWNKILNQHVAITSRQTDLLVDVFNAISANQRIPPATATELQSLVERQRRVINSGIRTLTRQKTGTVNGAAFKKLVLRYLRIVARPLNECVAKLLAADSLADLQEVVQCVDSTDRARVSLQRSLDGALKKMAVRRLKCS